MGLKTSLSILRFEFHAMGAFLVSVLLLACMLYLFGSWRHSYAILASFAILVFLISLVRIEIGLGLLVIGMLFSPETEVGIGVTQGVRLRAEDFLIVALVMAWVVQRVLLGVPLKSTPLNLPILLFLTSTVLSTVGGIAVGYYLDRFQAVFYIGKLIEFFAVYFFAVNFIKDEKQIFFLLTIFFMVGLAVSLYGLSQVGEIRRISAPFEGETPEPNTFGGYLMTVIALAIPLALYTPYVSVRIALCAVASTAFSALLFTLSRASFLGMIGMAVVLGLLSRSRVIWFGLLLFVAVHQFILPEEVFQRINYTFQSASGKEVILPFTIPFVGDTIQVDTSTFERIDVWTKVLHTWTLDPYHFFFGWGVTRMQILDSQFARFLIEIGLVGTMLFGFVLWTIFRSSYWLTQNAESWVVRGFAIGYLACFIGVLIHSLGTITFYIVRIMEPFWFLTGILFWWYVRERILYETGEDPDDVQKRAWQPDLPWRQVDA
ncbi:MAG: O-antigen ligase family protein [Candidatus Omnitrophica bacterium]|nr:O-antigen ligase family protein [Candidatus Omnitrophota bacterium]